MDSNVHIQPLNLVGEDQRGKTYDYQLLNRVDYIFLIRKAGSISGNAYHAGKVANTNPKTFVLLSGKIEFLYRHIDESEHHMVVLEQPCIITVKPKVTHAVRAITDMSMLEANSIEDLRLDRERELVVTS